MTLMIVALTWVVRGGAASGYLLAAAIQSVVSVGAISLGVLAFYGDNRNGRKAFLADRGVGPTVVWWTRVLPVMSAYLPIQILQVLVITIPSSFTGIEQGVVLGTLDAVVATLIIFVSGIFISQCIERPVLAFLAAPCHALFVLSMNVQWSPSFLVSGALSVAILLFGSCRLTQRWFEGRVDVRFAARAIGYTALAIGVPTLHFVWKVCTRFAQLALVGVP